MPNYTACTRVT